MTQTVPDISPLMPMHQDPLLDCFIGFVCLLWYIRHGFIYTVLLQNQTTFTVLNRLMWLPIYLTHWGRVTHICVGKLVIIGSDNGLSLDRWSEWCDIWNTAPYSTVITTLTVLTALNTLRPRQNGRLFADLFKCVSLNENLWILNKIWLKYVPWGLIDNMAAWVQIMAWRRTGDKPLSEPMLVCYTGAYMRHSASMKVYVLAVTYTIYVVSYLTVWWQTWLNVTCINHSFVIVVIYKVLFHIWHCYSKTWPH